MSIYLVTGPPGTGKSWFSVRTAFSALESGKWLASNIEFTEGWEQKLARHNPLRWIRPHGRAKGARRYRERTYVSGDLDEMMRLRLPGCKRCNACRAGGTCRREERGVMILDEAHLWLNARTWDQDDTGVKADKAKAVAKRLAVVKFFAEHRKLGWRVYLVTQDESRIDNQVRGNAEFAIKLKNLKKYRALGFIPLIPFNLFVAITTWHGTGRERVGVSMYMLGKLKDCYDTMATSAHGMQQTGEGLIFLPLSEQQRQDRARGGGPPARPEAGREDGRTGGAAAPDDRPHLPTPALPAGATPLRPGELPIPAIAGITEERS